jgi:hypothetical protein
MEQKEMVAQKSEKRQVIKKNKKKSVWELCMDPSVEPLITKIVDMRAVLR